MILKANTYQLRKALSITYV